MSICNSKLKAKRNEGRIAILPALNSPHLPKDMLVTVCDMGPYDTEHMPESGQPIY